MKGWDSKSIALHESRMAADCARIADKQRIITTAKNNPYAHRPPEPLHAHADDSPAMKITPSTDESKLNKTERAYLEWLRYQGYVWIGVQNITLKLADDTRFTCDFFCMTKDGELHGREVKGFFRDDAKVKIKVAARMFPFIKFSVVKRDGQGWKHKEVSP